MLHWRLWDQLDRLGQRRRQGEPRRALALLPAFLVLLAWAMVLTTGVDSVFSGAWLAASIELGVAMLLVGVRVAVARARLRDSGVARAGSSEPAGGPEPT
jgi:hypothetical protein